jgi:hypothetical protein
MEQADRRRKAGTMNAKLVAEAEELLRTAMRLQRLGLIIDSGALSPAHRRAAFALQCHFAGDSDEPKPKTAVIGFRYPNAR